MIMLGADKNQDRHLQNQSPSSISNKKLGDRVVPTPRSLWTPSKLRHDLAKASGIAMIPMLLLVMAILTTRGAGGGLSPNDAHAEPPSSAFFQVSGTRLLKDGQPITLQGTNICNYAISDSGRTPYAWYVTEQDYAHLASWGANVVRLSLSHEWFSVDGVLSSNAVGIQYIDRHLGWGKTHGISLILDLHIPPGGYQGYSPEDDASQAIWEDQTLQDQFVDLWVFIAKQYKDETAIVGYGLMNEPATTDEHYLPLVERTIHAIRTEAEDEHHIIFVAQSMDDTFHDQAFDDPNIVYEFHFYEPFLFTHQGVDWLPGAIDPADVFRYPATIEEVWYDKAKLKALIQHIMSAPNHGQVAFMLGEFAANAHADQTSRAQYYRDVYQIAQELEIPIILNWAFRDPDFGFYDWDHDAASEDGTGYETSRTDQVTPNHDLIKLFQELWLGTPTPPVRDRPAAPSPSRRLPDDGASNSAPSTSTTCAATVTIRSSSGRWT